MARAVKVHKHTVVKGYVFCDNPAAHKDSRNKNQRKLLGAYCGHMRVASRAVYRKAKAIRKTKGITQAIGYLKAHKK